MFTRSERRLTKRGSLAPDSLSAAEATVTARTKAADSTKRTASVRSMCRLDIPPCLLLMPGRTFCGHRRHAVETAIRDRHPQAPGSDRDPDDGAFYLPSQP